MVDKLIHLRKTHNLASIFLIFAVKADSRSHGPSPTPIRQMEKLRLGGAGTCPRPHRENAGPVCAAPQSPQALLPPGSGPASPNPEVPGRPRGGGPGLLPYPPGSLVGSWLGPQGRAGREQRGARRGSGASLQAHDGPRRPPCHRAPPGQRWLLKCLTSCSGGFVGRVGHS